MANPHAHVKQVPVQVLIDKEDQVMVEENEKKCFAYEQRKNQNKKANVHYDDTLSDGSSSFRNNSNSTSNQELYKSESGGIVGSFGSKTQYPFYTMQSRKKEKKKIRAKINKIVSRVHNTDCLLKKIKAKYLKYLFLTIKEETTNIDTRKFDQCVEVRNLNIHHNRNNFLNLTIAELLVKNKVMTVPDIKYIEKQNNLKLIELLRKKVKFHYQFDFLHSEYYQNWIKDPIKIYQNINARDHTTYKHKKSTQNKNCLKYPNHSKNIFKNNTEHYEIYIKLLIITSCNFIFYFQNNPLKFGKKTKRLS
jgi:hypothetical protein